MKTNHIMNMMSTYYRSGAYKMIQVKSFHSIWVRTSQRTCSFAHRTGRQLIVQEGKHDIDVQIYEATNATQHCAVSGFAPQSNGNLNYALNQMEIEIVIIST